MSGPGPATLRRRRRRERVEPPRSSALVPARAPGPDRSAIGARPVPRVPPRFGPATHAPRTSKPVPSRTNPNPRQKSNLPDLLPHPPPLNPTLLRVPFSHLGHLSWFKFWKGRRATTRTPAATRRLFGPSPPRAPNPPEGGEATRGRRLRVGKGDHSFERNDAGRTAEPRDVDSLGGTRPLYTTEDRGPRGGT